MTPWATPATDTFHGHLWEDGSGVPPNNHGVFVSGYEYRRYQEGAIPYFPAVGFPGQYQYDESVLYQN